MRISDWSSDVCSSDLLPPLNGFLSKEMMLEEAAHTGWHGIAWLVPVIAVAAATLSVAYSLRYIFQVYLGPRRQDYPHPPHDPPFGLWGPSALLVLLAVLAGLFPMTVTGDLVTAASGAVIGAQIGRASCRESVCQYV